MGKAKDLIGQKFGKLTVKHLGENSKRGERQWWCECDCGNPELVLVIGSRLTGGYKTHCNKCKIYEDLTGKCFGRLKVIKQGEDYIDKNGYSYRRWWCLCDCQENLPTNEQNLKLIRESDLKTGSIQSCGCLQKERAYDIKRKYNKYDLLGEYGIGYTDKNEEFYFDLEDYYKIKDYCWYINDDGYVVAHENDKLVLFHRVVMDEHSKYEIDHILGYNFRNDNRKSNLRRATHSQNGINKRMQSNNTSGYVGVGKHKRTQKWRAYIIINKKQIELGLFDNKMDAVKARKIAEEKYFGEWSYDNSQKTQLN